LETQLLYDCEDEKEVDFIRELPLEYTSSIDETGFVAVVEIKIKVLSSQLEDMSFQQIISESLTRIEEQQAQQRG
jgi:hypothetical protein